VTWSAWLICALVAFGVGYLSLAGFVWANREGVGSRPLIVMLLGVKVWSLCYAFELSSRSEAVAQWWSALKYVGIVALPPALWSFVLAYTGRGKLSRRALRLLLIHPVVLLVLLAVPATHDLIQQYGTPPKHLLDAPVPGAGPLFWPHAVYVYTLMLGAVFTLTFRLTRIAAPYRRQGALLVAASLLPCVGNVLYNAGIFANGMIDPTPFLFGITAIVLVWGFFRLRALDLTPVARGIVIEQMADGVLVLDVYGRVADVNKAGSQIIGHPRRSMVGRSAIDIVPGLAPVLDRADIGSETGNFEGEVLVYPSLIAEPVGALREITALEARSEPVPRGSESGPGSRASAHRSLAHRSLLEPLGTIPVAVAVPSRIPEQVVLGPPRDVAVSLTWVTDPLGRQIARLVVLRDITERKRTEQQLRDLLDEQTKLSETLRQSLRPASLPDLTGLRLAARSVPSARGQGVGGDFYDVHPAGDGVNAFVLGDVSGKGVHAAVVTSMARYTVRTLSAQGWPPREVLQQLNRALQTPDDLERFCTVVYGHVLPPVPDLNNPDLNNPELNNSERLSSGVRIVLTLGGHPAPLLRRRDRSVIAVGRPGTALGMLPTVDVHEVIVDMAAGDVLLAYTDGVTEARDGEEQFGEKRLADILAAVPDDFTWNDNGRYDHPAAQLANAVADSVLNAVRTFSSERDDVALLVLAAT
jgi:serine phosphatase RsbU (regulator of sigma subunit)